MIGADERAQVLDALARFAHGIDGRDWELYRSVFADQIEVDYSSYRPGSAGTMAADDWVGRARRLFPGLEATQHLLTNAWVRADGDGVLAQTSMRADHFLDGSRYTLGGHYVHRLRREQQSDWVITGVTLVVTWQEGDKAMLAVAAERVGSR